MKPNPSDKSEPVTPNPPKKTDPMKPNPAKTEATKADAGNKATNIKMFTDRECGVQGINFGSLSTPEDCAIVAKHERY